MNHIPKTPLAKHFFIPQNYNTKHSPDSSKNNSYQNISHQFTNTDIIRLHKENSILKEQNQALKKQLTELKKDQKRSSPQVIDLRQTVKKQAGQIKQLKMRLEILSKQCTVYQQIIEKMQQRIKKLTTQNKKYLENLQSNQNKQHQLQSLKKQAENIYSQYLELQLKVKANDLDWSLWKDHWERERQYYVDKILKYTQQNKQKYTTSLQNKYKPSQSGKQS